MRTLVVITNIPSPYRLHLFERLYERAQRRHIVVEVWFMAANEPGRFWPYDPTLCHFPHRLLAGVHPMVAGIPFHINPTAWWNVVRDPPTWLFLGGGWEFPTVFVLALLAGLYRRQTHILIHAEANIRSSTFLNGPVAAFRRRILEQAEVLVVPGRIALETIERHWNIRGKGFIPLANVVDERRFFHDVHRLRYSDPTLRSRYALSQDDFVVLFPARLDERTKGNLSFLQAVGPLLSEARLKVLMAGEGPDRVRIESWLKESRTKNVRLLGNRSFDQMLELYAVADLLVLPSRRDPNPLTVIEGLWAGLPVLTSVNCGNWPETVEIGGNGWLVDPEYPQTVYEALAEAMTLPRQRLSNFRARSLAIAQERFDTMTIVEQFLDAIVSL